MRAIVLVHRLVDEVWNGGRLDLLPELFADPFDHDGTPDTVESLRAWHARQARTWAGMRYEILREVADGPRVAVHWQATARQVGQWGPVLPTGREVSWRGAHFFTVAGGKIVALWASAGMIAVATQLGVRLSAPEP